MRSLHDEYYNKLRIICEKRKSVRRFSAKEVSNEDIEKIKEIAYTSPYASGRKNWELVIVRDRSIILKIAEIVRKHMDEIARRIREDFRNSFASYAENFTFFETSPVLIVPTFRITSALSFMLTTPDEKITQWERDNYVKSISCVAMLVLLAAESLGLGGCYMTGPLIAEEEIAKVINIRKGRNIGAIIPIGYPIEGHYGYTK
jgi:nitroreductase